MIQSQTRSSTTSRVTYNRGVSSAGILSEIDLDSPPFSGNEHCFFDEDLLDEGIALVRKGWVNVGNVNLQGSFAGIFGRVRASNRDFEGTDVSLLVQKTIDNQWLIDGKSGEERAEKRSVPVAALFIAALIEKGVLELPTEIVEEKPATGVPVVKLSTRDVRAGILHWDDSELRAVLENLTVVEIENPTMELLQRVRDMGMKQIAATYPFDEILPEFQNCYAYTGVRRSTQELFWADFLANRRKELEEIGCEIVIDPDMDIQVVDSQDWYGEFSGDSGDQGVDWFGFECGIFIDGQRVNIVPCLVKYLEDKPPGFNLTDFEKIPPESKIPITVNQGTGKYVAIPAKKLHTILGILTELFDRAPLTEDEKVKVHPVRAAQLASYDGEDKIVSEAPEELKQLSEDFESLKPSVDPEVPKDFQATLRPYQQDGFEWLQFLREKGVGGILADDMGLGKTIQTLCHLHHEKVSGRADLPTLIIAPKSVVPGWEKEAKKFAPSLTVLTLQGPESKEILSGARLLRSRRDFLPGLAPRCRRNPSSTVSLRGPRRSAYH